MPATTAKWIFMAVVCGVVVTTSQTAEATGYYYRARSLYVTPPVYSYLPVFGQPPIVVYEPVPTYPAPVAGYYGPTAALVPVAAPGPATPAAYYEPAPAVVPAAAVVPAPIVAPAPVVAPVGRVRERQVVTPFHSRYRYHVENPRGPDYNYRVRQNGGVVRFTERW